MSSDDDDDGGDCSSSSNEGQIDDGDDMEDEDKDLGTYTVSNRMQDVVIPILQDTYSIHNEKNSDDTTTISEPCWN